MKATSCIGGPNDDIVLPRGSQKTDWEVELGVVIGTTAKYVGEGERVVPRRRLLRHQRCVGARVSARRDGTVGQGQERRHVRPDRPVARDARRSAGLGQRSTCGSTSTASAGSDGSTKTMVFGVPFLDQLSQPFHEPATRRRHLDRHAAGRRARVQAAGLSARGRRGAPRGATGSASSGKRLLDRNLSVLRSRFSWFFVVLRFRSAVIGSSFLVLLIS